MKPLNNTRPFLSLIICLGALLCLQTTGCGDNSDGKSKRVCLSEFFELVGDLRGDAFDSDPNDISADGKRVVGNSYADDPNVPTDGNSWFVGGPHSHAFQAFGWTRPCESKPFMQTPLSILHLKGGIVGLGYLPSDPTESSARGISPDGKVVAGWCYVGAGSMNEAVLFGLKGSKIRLGKLPGDLISLAADVSNGYLGKLSVSRPDFSSTNIKALGEISRPRIVVGYSSPKNDHPKKSDGARAVYWGPWFFEIRALPLPATLPNGAPIKSSEATCISDDASIIGGSLYYGDVDWNLYSMKSFGCVWRLNRTTGEYSCVVLNDLPGGTEDSKVAHVSGNGEVLVGSGTDDTGQRACLWECHETEVFSDPFHCGQPVNLGILPGQDYSLATGTNHDGSVIVGVCGRWPVDPPPGFENKALIWHYTPGGITSQPENIVDILNDKGIPVDRSWQLMAKRVSSDGRIVTGIVFHPDSLGSDSWVQEGWVAGIP